jgi:hypothetical protein
MSRANVQPEPFARWEFGLPKRARQVCFSSPCLGLGATLVLVACSASSPSLPVESPHGVTASGPKSPKGTDAEGAPPVAPQAAAPQGAAFGAVPPESPRVKNSAVLTLGALVQVHWDRGLVQLHAGKALGRVKLKKAERGVGILMLDEERWRRVPPGGLGLNELLPEDQEPSPGRHRLLGCHVDGDNFHCEQVFFAVGGGLEGPDIRGENEAWCVLFEPGGTIWGGAEVPLLVLGSGGPGAPGVDPSVRVSLELRGPGAETQHFDLALDRRGSLRLGSGDYDVRVSCGQAVTSRTITVNSLEMAP